MPEDTPIFDALLSAQRRGLLPTSLDTAGLRELGADLLARSVFSARVANADFLSKLKQVVDAIAGGNMDESTARVTLLEALRATGYTPEGGFPDAPPGEVPPALRGTLQDLSSHRRLHLIVTTQRDLMRGAGQQLRGHERERLAEFPAWELIRELSAHAPRNWGGRYMAAPSHRFHDPRPRWTIAGGKLTGGRMIALKGDPIWGELGSAENFGDALSTDHPPFAFNSGMGWREVSRAECEKLGITGPGGQSIDAFLSGPQRPRVISGPLPVPQASVATMDPAIRSALASSLPGSTVTDGTLTLDALEARRAERLRQAIAARKAELKARS